MGFTNKKFISFKLAFLLNMKILLFSLLCLILIGMTSYSYAAEGDEGDFMIGDVEKWIVPDRNTKIDIEVMLQLELRDSNGGLVAYIEADQIIGYAPLELNKWLDAQNQTRKEFFIKDDKKYESQRWEIKGDEYTEKLAYSLTRLIEVYQHELVTLVQIRHDSFQTQPGDTVRIYWTMIRPAS